MYDVHNVQQDSWSHVCGTVFGNRRPTSWRDEPCFQYRHEKCGDQLFRLFDSRKSKYPAFSYWTFTKVIMTQFLCEFAHLWLQERMKMKVEYMGGIFIKQLRHCNTHLVTNSVMSAKYEVWHNIFIFEYVNCNFDVDNSNSKNWHLKLCISMLKLRKFFTIDVKFWE